MLTDAEVVSLRKDESYIKATGAGVKGLATDLIRAGNGDLKPSIGTALKLTYALVRARVIRSELSICSRTLLERLLNHELAWGRSPDDVRHICEAEGEGYVWMRYDGPRVEALFRRVRTLLQDAEVRERLKAFASTPGIEKNAALSTAIQELDILAELTLESIGTKGLFDSWTKLRADRFYRAHESEIKRGFLESSQGGALGSLPPYAKSEGEDHAG